MNKFPFQWTKKKECTVLTWPSKILLLVLLVTFFGILFFKMPLYLSKSAPEKEGLLVIDGQMPDFLIQEAIRIFQENNYKKIIASGGDLPAGRFISGEKSMAGITRATLLELGFDSLKIVTLHGGPVLRNRTFASALKLKHWLAQNGRTEIKKVDVITLGCHAGRSRLLFQKALGNDYQVGVWSVPDKSYDIKRWWKTSKGSRTVISEIIAYFYARFFSGEKE